ncbi:MAG: hypothetical protein GPOALKHO_001487 [Sodalis sp.]|nr:MAG: hypothetical protein GPOALKHO_001487 [Sodalis sp.]
MGNFSILNLKTMLARLLNSHTSGQNTSEQKRIGFDDLDGITFREINVMRFDVKSASRINMPVISEKGQRKFNCYASLGDMK